MLKYKTLSLHYTHHPYHVLEIHKNLAQLLNEQKGFDFKEPKLIKLGYWPFRTPNFISESKGIIIRSTTKDAHDNFLIVYIDENKHSYLSKCNDIRKLGLIGIEDILKTPTNQLNRNDS